MTSFLRRSGKLSGGLYCAEIISHFMIYPSRIRRPRSIFFFASALRVVTYPVYLSTALREFSTFLKRIFALCGFGRVSRVYILGIVNAMMCLPPHIVVFITGVVMAIFSGARIVCMRVELTPINVLEVFPPKIYPASCLNPAYRAFFILPSTSTSATI